MQRPGDNGDSTVPDLLHVPSFPLGVGEIGRHLGAFLPFLRGGNKAARTEGLFFPSESTIGLHFGELCNISRPVFPETETKKPLFAFQTRVRLLRGSPVEPSGRYSCFGMDHLPVVALLTLCFLPDTAVTIVVCGVYFFLLFRWKKNYQRIVFVV